MKYPHIEIVTSHHAQRSLFIHAINSHVATVIVCRIPNVVSCQAARSCSVSPYIASMQKSRPLPHHRQSSIVAYPLCTGLHALGCGLTISCLVENRATTLHSTPLPRAGSIFAAFIVIGQGTALCCLTSAITLLRSQVFIVRHAEYSTTPLFMH